MGASGGRVDREPVDAGRGSVPVSGYMPVAREASAGSQEEVGPNDVRWRDAASGPTERRARGRRSHGLSGAASRGRSAVPWRRCHSSHRTVRGAAPALRRSGGFLLLTLLLALGVSARFAAAQTSSAAVRVELGVEPHEVTVGDPFRSVVRVALPEGYSLRYHELESGDSLAATAPVTVTRGEDGQDVAVYSLVAWAAAPDLSATVQIEMTGPDGVARSQNIRLQLPLLRSVLPASDEVEIAPRPPRGPIDPVQPAFPWWLLALLVATLVGYLTYRYWTRRQPVPEIEPDPRARALEQLSGETIRLLAEREEHGRIVELVGLTLRIYIEQMERRFGRDLTTSELLGRLQPVGGPFAVGGQPERTARWSEASRELHAVLRLADRVKFARYAPSLEEAREALDAGRAWVQRYPHPEEPEEPGRAA